MNIFCKVVMMYNYTYKRECKRRRGEEIGNARGEERRRGMQGEERGGAECFISCVHDAV